MIDYNVTEFVMNERNILQRIDNDYIVRGMWTFQSKTYLYMVMEYMPGGDFGSLIEKLGCFNYETAKCYLAHIVLALEHIHSKGIVHRDLKPDNILISADGHVKLTDFGLSEVGLRKMLDHVDGKNIQCNAINRKGKRSGSAERVFGDFKTSMMEKEMQMNFGVAEYDLIPVKEKKLISYAQPDYADLTEATTKF